MERPPGRWAEWVNLLALTGEPVLVGSNAATVARRLEGSSRRRLVAGASEALGPLARGT